MTTVIIVVFQLTVLIFSVMIHEISHGFVADYLGDPTARLAGRLTLNPLKHLDAFGSFILPASLWLLSGGTFVFGWAKPVPYNPLNLKNPRKAAGEIASAGPVSNLIIAAVFGVILRFLPSAVVSSTFLGELFGLIVYLNLLLAVFNLVPIPPLDGSKILFAILPESESTSRAAFFLERYGLLLVLLFVFFGFQLILPLVYKLFFVFTGQPLALF